MGKIKTSFTPNPTKTPKSINLPSSDSNHISWRFSKVDRDGKWKCSLNALGEDKTKEIIRKLKDFDSMTWGDFKGKRRHSIPVNTISREAKKRLEDIQRDDIDVLFSVGISGKERIWGVREGDVFSILWWDPEHEVYPSTLKNT